ncbi:hypothetical protein CC85DRAFT_41280 [Cutaneotrichosporon oleaginosum]|uniref:Uncharacterized protein n=1 Tax=Cutaneotrichosporon oleaginosum TaxID=879819 RepID=A0A0J0XB74_9TREE|nr:uncharacterized protein CC85DRAFT_41280 [Cutaneotrichosporon oleaginosum]KLT38308.1 hypothetical protein CC85DRAFT_41280 [Cutaneotrichosporon oleaginosum]TXT07010.1 hypothetical protein COLE_06341 [Cutaneotrichosporon oleaginosum]
MRPRERPATQVRRASRIGPHHRRGQHACACCALCFAALVGSRIEGAPVRGARWVSGGFSPPALGTLHTIRIYKLNSESIEQRNTLFCLSSCVLVAVEGTWAQLIISVIDEVFSTSNGGRRRFARGLQTCIDQVERGDDERW